MNDGWMIRGVDKVEFIWRCRMTSGGIRPIHGKWVVRGAAYQRRFLGFLGCVLIVPFFGDRKQDFLYGWELLPYHGICYQVFDVIHSTARIRMGISPRSILITDQETNTRE